MLEDSVNVFRDLSPHSLATRELSVLFDGEDGMDEGGLTREWMQVLCRALFKEENGLFKIAGDGTTYQPNPQSHIHSNHLSYFLFLGQLLGKALIEQIPLDVHLTKSVYKHLLGQSVTFDDLEAYDPGYYRNLTTMLEYSLEDLGLSDSLSFTVESTLFDETCTHELLPGGESIVVTEDNKREYVRLLAHHHMTSGIKGQIDAILEGFHMVIPPALVSFFNAQELELLTCGMPEIDVDDMEAHTLYVNYTRKSDQIVWIWSILRRMTHDEQAKFVAFVTGSSKVPLEGFKALKGSAGVIQKLTIHKAYGTSSGDLPLPVSHTCFNQLDLPEYTDEETMRRKILQAINETEGFGLA